MIMLRTGVTAVDLSCVVPVGTKYVQNQNVMDGPPFAQFVVRR